MTPQSKRFSLVDGSLFSSSSFDNLKLTLNERGLLTAKYKLKTEFVKIKHCMITYIVKRKELSVTHRRDSPTARINVESSMPDRRPNLSVAQQTGIIDKTNINVTRPSIHAITL